jgi:hypothetical protein
MAKIKSPDEFPKLQAGSLRKGFVIVYEGKVRTIVDIDKRSSTVRIWFDDHYNVVVLNEKIVEVVVKNRKERKKR